MIWNVPIESLEERYSKDWNKWFPEYWNSLEGDVEYRTVYGERLKDCIETGSFLDVVDTNYFKADQLKQICKIIDNGEVKGGDVFFFHDLWFPGLEMLAYIRDALKIKFKIMGIFHAGTYDPFDFTAKAGMGSWGASLENSWLRIIDKVFVATHFHKNLLKSKRLSCCDIVVTGLPIKDEFSKPIEKENIIVFPHRLDSEKQPDKFRELKKFLCERYPDWQFIETKSVCRTKEEYYDMLNKSRIAVSFALQETWGIAMQEAVICGCIPVVPSRVSYEEMYDSAFQYHTLTYPNTQMDVYNCRLLMEVVLKNLDKYEKKRSRLCNVLISKGAQAIEKITEHLLSKSSDVRSEG